MTTPTYSHDPTGSSRIAVALASRPSCLPHGASPLAANPVAGHGATGEREAPAGTGRPDVAGARGRAPRRPAAGRVPGETLSGPEPGDGRQSGSIQRARAQDGATAQPIRALARRHAE